jgi:type II secretion system protein H
MPPAACQRTRAFTLIELLVVLAIIGVVAGVVVPYAGTTAASMRLRQAALTLAAHIRFAQALAVDRGLPTRILIDAQGRGYGIEIAEDLAGTRFVRAPGIFEDFIRLPKDVRLNAVGLEFKSDGLGDTLLFDSVGEWTTGRVRLSDGVGTLVVRINDGLGRVDVFDASSAEDTETAHDYADPLDTPK